MMALSPREKAARYYAKHPVACRQRAARYYARHTERCRARWREWSRTPSGIVTVLLNYARDRARRGDLAFELDRAFVEQKLDAGVCELTGLPLEPGPSDKHRVAPMAPSLDRIVPSKGYTKANTRMVCFAVNRARSDWGDAVLLRIAQALVDRDEGTG